MNEFFLYLFALSCAGLLLWGMKEPTRIYQYPFLMGAIFTSFLMPQAIALVNNPGPIPRSAINQTFLMGSLCMLMIWLGYRLRPLESVRNNSIWRLRSDRIHTVGIITAGISLLSVYFILKIPQQEIASGRGPFTIFAFFSGLATISFPLFLKIALAKPNIKNWAIAVITGYPLYSAAFFAGRRSQTAAFFIILLLILFFQKKYTVPRLPALVAALFVMLLIPIFAAIRQDFWGHLFSGNWNAIDWEGPLEKVLEGDVLELRNAAANIVSTLRTGNYGYGTGYWDALVFRYVPGQLVGYGFKESLQFRWTGDVYDAIGYFRSTGSTSTAIGDTFKEFGYFGCLFFLFQGYLFKNIWWLAVNRDSLIAQLLYIGLIPVALISISHGTYWFFQGGLVIVLVIYAAWRFARIKDVKIDENAKSNFTESTVSYSTSCQKKFLHSVNDDFSIINKYNVS